MATCIVYVNPRHAKWNDSFLSILSCDCPSAELKRSGSLAGRRCQFDRRRCAREKCCYQCGVVAREVERKMPFHLAWRGFIYTIHVAIT
jgi:hypothetical protein